jgi:hypothetical protein
MNRSVVAVTLDEPELELAPPAPERANVALPYSPQPELQHAELEATGDEQVEASVTIPAKVAGR